MDEDKRCGTCRWWERRTTKHGACDAITRKVNGDNYGDARDDAVIDVHVADDTSLDTDLVTREDFCCTLYNKKG